MLCSSVDGLPENYNCAVRTMAPGAVLVQPFSNHFRSHHFLYFIPLDFGFVFVLALLFGAQSAEDRAGRQMSDLFFRASSHTLQAKQGQYRSFTARKTRQVFRQKCLCESSLVTSLGTLQINNEKELEGTGRNWKELEGTGSIAPSQGLQCRLRQLATRMVHFEATVVLLLGRLGGREIMDR